MRRIRRGSYYMRLMNLQKLRQPTKIPDITWNCETEWRIGWRSQGKEFRMILCARKKGACGDPIV